MYVCGVCVWSMCLCMCSEFFCVCVVYAFVCGRMCLVYMCVFFGVYAIMCVLVVYV